MITVKQIRGAQSYFENHLSANDYYSEGETVTGHWRGKLAEMLGLEGKEVNREDFQSLRNNEHPETGAKLRPRIAEVKFHDIVVSAPKSYSIMAMVGCDERLVEEFNKVALKALSRLEAYSGVRDRKGVAVNTEGIIRTGNVCAATFTHDTSRLLDPQLHMHLVTSNHSYSPETGQYLALQPKVMMEEAKRWITDQFHRDLAKVAKKLGYETEIVANRMRIAGVTSEIEEVFSERTQQRKRFEKRYENLFEREPSKKRIEYFIKEGRGAAQQRFADEYRAEFGKSPAKDEVDNFVKEWRSTKMLKSTKQKVKVRQLGKLNTAQIERIDGLVASAKLACQGQDELAQDETEKEHQALSNPMEEVKTTLKPEMVQKKRKLKTKQRNKVVYSNSVGRTEAIRRMRRGMAIAQALRGHPMVFILQQVSSLAQNRR